MWTEEKSSLAMDAEEIIEKEFKDVKDKGGQPYLGHIYRVAEPFLCYESYVSALLHDLIEDIPSWHEIRLRDKFGDEIGDIVMCLTKKQNESYESYLKRVSSNQKATAIKMQDLRDNMDYTRLPELTDKDIERLKKYHKSYMYLKSNKPI